MSSLTLALLTAQLQCAEELDAGRRFMFEPQDLPGRYGRVVKSLDLVLQAVGCQAVVGKRCLVRGSGRYLCKPDLTTDSPLLLLACGEPTPGAPPHQ